jgi:hypothetical protein
MNMDKGFLRSFILSVVKPLKSGKVVDQKDQNAGLDNLHPDGGYDSKFRMTSPFGFISRVPKGVTGFYQGLFGSSFENILLGLLHAKRPVPVGVGEVILYSTDATGAQVKTKLTLTNDGKLIIDCLSDISITCVNASISATGNVAVSCNNASVIATNDVTLTCKNATVNASVKAKIDSPAIELGGSALEKIINGETFKPLFESHIHPGNLGFPTGPPTISLPPDVLSETVKAAK